MKTSADLIGVVFGLILIAIILTASVFWRSYQCSSYGDLTSRDTKYTVTNGCFVKYDDKFIPRSELERRFIMNNQEK